MSELQSISMRDPLCGQTGNMDEVIGYLITSKKKGASCDRRQDLRQMTLGDLCSFILSFGDQIWPSILPDSILVKLWISVKDGVLNLLSAVERHAAGEHVPDLPVEVLMDTISLFLSQCPDLPFEAFWKECADALVKLTSTRETEAVVCTIFHSLSLLQGLIHLMATYCSRGGLFQCSQSQEPSLSRCFFLLQMLLQLEDDVASVFSDCWKTYNNSHVVRDGFRTILDLFQTSEFLMRTNDTNLLATQHILQELSQINEDEWLACFAALIHNILAEYLKKGPTILEQAPSMYLLQLLSDPSFAHAFLNSITTFPDSQGANVSCRLLSAAFQIFELTYRKYPGVMMSCCLAKLVDDESNSVFLRLQCVNLLGRMENWNMNFVQEAGKVMSFWNGEAFDILSQCILRDSSVRVRRSAMQILLQIVSDNGVKEKEIVQVCMMKIRDQDEKLQLMALEKLASFSIKTLSEHLSCDDWKIIFKQGFSKKEKREFIDIVEALLLEYVNTDLITGAPSTKLCNLGILCSKKALAGHMLADYIYKHVEAIFSRELQFLEDFGLHQD